MSVRAAHAPSGAPIPARAALAELLYIAGVGSKFGGRSLSAKVRRSFLARHLKMDLLKNAITARV